MIRLLGLVSPAFAGVLNLSKPGWWDRFGVLEGVILFSYMDWVMTPVVAMLIGLGLLGPVPGLNFTEDEAGVSVPLIALGDRPLAGLTPWSGLDNDLLAGPKWDMD